MFCFVLFCFGDKVDFNFYSLYKLVKCDRSFIVNIHIILRRNPPRGFIFRFVLSDLCYSNRSRFEVFTRVTSDTLSVLFKIRYLTEILSCFESCNTSS